MIETTKDMYEKYGFDEICKMNKKDCKDTILQINVDDLSTDALAQLRTIVPLKRCYLVDDLQKQFNNFRIYTTVSLGLQGLAIIFLAISLLAK